MTAPRRRAAGFTLLEVLIATSLLGMMMLVLMGSLRIGAASWDAGEERMAEAARLFTVQNFLRAHVGGALPLAGTVQGGRTAFMFRGGPDFLEYVAALPSQVKSGGLYRFRLYVAKDGEAQDLRLAILPYVSGQDADDAVEPVDDLVLFENLGSFKLSYLPREDRMRQNTRSWLDEWEQTQFPALVRVDIEPENGEPWPSLVIALKILRLR
jgi:general secretion pathway protein J